MKEERLLMHTAQWLAQSQNYHRDFSRRYRLLGFRGDLVRVQALDKRSPDRFHRDFLMWENGDIVLPSSSSSSRVARTRKAVKP